FAFKWNRRKTIHRQRILMDSHSSIPGPGHSPAPAAHVSSSAVQYDPINNNSAGLQRRPKPSYLSYPHSASTTSHANRPSAFIHWDEIESSIPIESSGSSDVYSTPPDDILPTTLTKTPTYEYYGFVLYLVSGITYDEHANQFQTMNSASSLTDDFVPDLMDIPIGMVNACLYQHIEGISDEEEGADDGDDYDDDDGSYFDDSNPSDWEDSTEL
ncbi:hypothetical protein BGX27_004679, partial [Mortierella sp. AM989]